MKTAVSRVKHNLPLYISLATDAPISEVALTPRLASISGNRSLLSRWLVFRQGAISAAKHIAITEVFGKALFDKDHLALPGCLLVVFYSFAVTPPALSSLRDHLEVMHQLLLLSEHVSQREEGFCRPPLSACLLCPMQQACANMPYCAHACLDKSPCFGADCKHSPPRSIFGQSAIAFSPLAVRIRHVGVR